MSYLHDKKHKQKKYIKYIIVAVVVLVIFYFHNPIFNSLARFTHGVLRPLLVLGNNTGEKLENLEYTIKSKEDLVRENKELELKLLSMQNTIANYNSVLEENIDLKEILGRSVDLSPKTLAAILAKPNNSPYDTLVIDLGEEDGIQGGELVLALGDIPIGRINQVYKKTSKVVLFSTAQEVTDVVISGTNEFIPIKGRGGGNFEMVLPRDFEITKGKEVTLPGIETYIVARVETIISDQRDSYKKALLLSPVNVQDLKFVQVVP